MPDNGNELPDIDTVLKDKNITVTIGGKDQQPIPLTGGTSTKEMVIAGAALLVLAVIFIFFKNYISKMLVASYKKSPRAADMAGWSIFSALLFAALAAALGILDSTTSATLIGEDRATVAVESVFTHLIALRDALEADDERGITLATGKFEADISRLAEARADVGVRAQRVTSATDREVNLRIQDESLRSQVKDLDFTEASIRFSTLQQQLEAALLTAGQMHTMSLLDFLR